MVSVLLLSWPMQQSASPPPAFTVATVRQSADAEEWTMQIRGTHFVTHGTTVDDLITYAYDVQVNQIEGAPSWFRTARFDVEGVPDTAERPSREQLQAMVRRLLTERFALRMHTLQRNLPAYAVTVAPGTLKLHEAVVQPGFHPGYGIDYGRLTVKDMPVAGFALLLQRLVLDRPVVDQTGLAQHFDFDLHWTPDETQFTQMRGAGMERRSPEGDAAAPDLYTAMVEQLGLRLHAEKTAVKVLAIDSASTPSPN